MSPRPPHRNTGDAPGDDDTSTASRPSPFDATAVDEVRDDFRRFADTTRDVAPTYARLSIAVADDPDVAHIVLAAPPTQRNPVLLFAAVHWLLLRGSGHRLGDHYPTVGDTSAHRSRLVADFTDFVATHRAALTTVVAGRSTQTNEVGRGAVLLPALATVAGEVGPLGLVDLGTSAGLNLSMDAWTYRWTRHDDRAGDSDGDRVVVLDGDPRVVVTSDVLGPMALPTQVPAIPWRLGLDRAPLDVTRDDDATWLLACTWPDEPLRFDRLRAALDVVRAAPPTIRTGDLVDDLEEVVATVPNGLHPVLTSSWVLNYLPVERQSAFVATVDRIGLARDLDVVLLESPHQTPGLGLDLPPRLHPASVLTRLSWRGGTRAVEHLATAQSHASWIDPTMQRV